VCTPDDGWKYHPKYVEQFSDINKLCNVASCWMYIRILLGAHSFLHISRIRVNIVSLHDLCGSRTAHTLEKHAHTFISASNGILAQDRFVQSVEDIMYCRRQPR
jgi:hypothetical protein